jgi:hypothetical protein
MNFYLYDPITDRFLDVRQIIDSVSFSQRAHIVWATNSRAMLTGGQIDCIQELMLLGIGEEKKVSAIHAILTTEQWRIAEKIYEKMIEEPVECWYIEARGEPIFTSLENGIL